MNPKVKIATYNIFLRLDRWAQRLPLIVAELNQIDADIICLQEVVLPRNTALEIAEQLDKKYYVTLLEDHQLKHSESVVAILSKKKPTEVSQLFLGSNEHRMALRASFKYGLREFDVVNTHLYWKPYHPLHKRIRLNQARRLLSWAKSDRPTVILGDMNATPRTRVMRYFYGRGYSSAYKQANGEEPAWTCANPVPHPERTPKELVALFFYNLIKRQRLGIWRGVLDYILIDSHWKVVEASLFGAEPSKGHRRLYPSDHLGLVAELRPLKLSKRTVK